MAKLLIAALLLLPGCAMVGSGCEVERTIRVSCPVEGGSVVIIPQH